MREMFGIASEMEKNGEGKEERESERMQTLAES